MSLIAQALVTADEAGSYLQIQNDDYDDITEQIINGVSQAFCTYTRRSLISTVYTAIKFNGSGQRFQFLPNWPVTALGSIVLDSVTLTLTSDYVYDAELGILTKVNGVWRVGLQNLVITKTAGYMTATLPSEIKLAALKQILVEYQRFISKSVGETSQSISGSSTSHVEGGLLKEVKEVLDFYRSWRA